MATLWGYNFPFYQGTTVVGVTSTVLPRVEDYRLIRNDYQQGLLTLQGERWFRPTFGGDVRKSQFDPNDMISQAVLKQNITQYTTKYHPQITISKIVFGTDSSNASVITISIWGTASLTATNTPELLAEFQLPDAG